MMVLYAESSNQPHGRVTPYRPTLASRKLSLLKERRRRGLVLNAHAAQMILQNRYNDP